MDFFPLQILQCQGGGVRKKEEARKKKSGGRRWKGLLFWSDGDGEEQEVCGDIPEVRILVLVFVFVWLKERTPSAGGSVEANVYFMEAK